MRTKEKRYNWALQVCLRSKMRLTPIREKILAYLATQRAPISLEAVMEAESLRGFCDAATAYRTLMLLRELEVIRQVSLPNKISYYVLNIPGQSSHFLICRCCGNIDELPASESVSALEREAASKQGYSRLSHELVVFGLCPECQKHPPGVLCAKVQPRMRPMSRFKPGLSNLSE
jgi:Fe2+ or Zn2+ uptake regulation protein